MTRQVLDGDLENCTFTNNLNGNSSKPTNSILSRTDECITGGMDFVKVEL